MYDVNEMLTKEEQENIAPDMRDMLAESSGMMTDFVANLLLAEAGMGVTGITSAVKGFSAARKTYKLRKVVKAGKKSQKFILKATTALEQSVIKAGMNEVRFSAAGADPGHGVAFHYVDNAIGRVVPVLLKRGNDNDCLYGDSCGWIGCITCSIKR